MEQPLSLAAEHIRMEKIKLLQAVQPLQLKDLLVGQYVAADGNPGYLEDPSITNKSSVTETFAAAVLYINNPRWDGVPFILKAGKALDESKVEVRIKFHAVPGVIAGLADCAPNELVIRVQPDERIFWKITSKVPGLDFTVETRRMDLLYASRGGSGTGSVGTQHPGVSRENSDSSPLIELPGAYERLILEVLRGDQTNFVHADELIASWRIFTPALHELAKLKVRPEPYAFGSAGPSAEDAFAANYGFMNGGFARHGDDAQKKRHAIAWGRSSGNGTNGPPSSNGDSHSHQSKPLAH